MENHLVINKRIFAIFFIINAAGYNYENNPAGSHFVRIKFQQIAGELLLKDSNFKKVVDQIKSLPFATNEYIRLANFFVFRDVNLFPSNSDGVDKIIEEKFDVIKKNLEEFYNSRIIEDLFKEYCDDIKEYSIVSETEIKDEIKNVFNFFGLSENVLNLKIGLHINFLDSYCRGTNYYQLSKQIISCSLNTKNEFNFSTFRHELMHIILKHCYNNDFSQYSKKIPVNKNYSQDSQRTKFEENFILAANLFFVPDEQKRKSNLKYFKDIGYSKIEKIYSIIEEYFVKQGLSLNSQTLDIVVDKF
jgi:hypothetical protein